MFRKVYYFPYAHFTTLFIWKTSVLQILDCKEQVIESSKGFSFVYGIPKNDLDQNFILDKILIWRWK